MSPAPARCPTPPRVMQSLLQIPQLRNCPPEVLRDLRAIDPQADLIYMGDGVWLLGAVNPSSIRWRAGQLKMKRAAEAKIVGDALTRRRKLARWRYIAWEGALLAQGFAPIAVFGSPDKPCEPDSRIVEYLRERTYCWARDLDAAWRRSLAADDSVESEQEAAQSSYFDEYKLRHAYKAMVKALRPARAVTVNQSLKSA